MKRIIYIQLVAVVVFLLGCQGGKQTPPGDEDDSLEVVADSTLYGICGAGTSMHSLELITDMEDTLHCLINMDETSMVHGGLITGDRLALIASKNADGEMEAHQVVNLTSLMGKWTSLDKNFEICEGGEVRSSVGAESRRWVAWKMLNGQLLLNADTFDIVQLGADSLALENATGIYIYKRQVN